MNRLVRGHHHLSIRRYFSSVPGLERDCKIRNPSSKRIGLSMYSPLALVISTFPLVRYRPFSGSVCIRNLKRPSWVNSKVAEPFTFNSRLRRFRCVVQTSFLYEDTAPVEPVSSAAAYPAALMEHAAGAKLHNRAKALGFFHGLPFPDDRMVQS